MSGCRLQAKEIHVLLRLTSSTVFRMFCEILLLFAETELLYPVKVAPSFRTKKRLLFKTGGRNIQKAS